jgi:hypothetical protein
LLSLLPLVLVPLPHPLGYLLVEKWLNANAARLRPEMTTKRIGAGKPPATAPLPAAFEFSLANELLFTRMKALVPFSVMLPRKRLATDSAHERAFIGMCSEMRA